MALQSLILPIVSLFRSAGITQARNALTGLNKDMKGLAGSVGRAAGAFAAFQGITGSRQFLLDAVENTQQFERNMLALGQVFEGLTPQMDRFTQAVQNYGIGQNQAAQASVFIGSVLKQYGFGVDEAADATQRIVKLAQDLATTYGYDVSEALLATTALFRGEFDPIEKFGVAMKQNEINAELLARGYGDLTGAQRENMEAIITLDFLFERASDSVGAFTRATDTLYAAQKRLEAGILNLQIAMGEPLQGPIADITNLFADLVDEFGPQLASLGQSVADSLQKATPSIEGFARTLFELSGIAQLALEVIESLANVFSTVLAPVLNAAAELVEYTALIFNQLRISGEIMAKNMGTFFEAILPDSQILDDLTVLDDLFESLDEGIEKFFKRIEDYNYANDEQARTQREVTYELQRFQLQADRSAEALIGMKKAAEQEELKRFSEAMRGLSVDAYDAEGNLIGVAKIFGELDDAAAKSNAKAELEALNVEAGLIEAVLEEPNWQQIFGEIAKYARLAAIDISTVSYAAAVGISNQMAAIAAGLPELFSTDEGGGGAVTNYVQDFYDSIEDAIAKESARRRLSTMGASEGLIEAILGSAGWETVFSRVIRDGVAGLQELQAEFNKTADGISELADATAELEQAQKDALNAARGLADSMQAIIDILGGLRLEDDLGQFESEIVNVFNAFNSQIESLYRNELISLENANRLKEWSKAYQDILVNIAQQRDKIAEQIKDTEEKLKASAQIRLSDADVKRLVEPLAVVGQSVNAYEQQVTESIDFIRTKLKEGLEKGVLTPGVVTELESLTKATSIALRSIAADRKALSDQYDELIRKQNDARLFKAATKEAILNYADVTNILKTASDRLSKAAKDATDKTTEIISQTIESSRNFRDYRVVLIREFLEPTAAATAKASDIADGLRKVLEDTRVFADNLRRLKELGLDPRLFKQIVDAGLEAGNSTAEAIIEGGPQTVREINDLYSEIEKVGAQAANLASQELFDGGEEMIQGVIDGLISKDADLAAEASAISQKLVDAFQANIDTYEVNLTNLLESLKSKEQAFKDAAKTLGSAFANTLTTYVNNALSGMQVPAFEVPEVKLPPEVEEIFGEEGMGKVGGGEDEAPVVVDPFARFGTGVATAIQDIGQSVGILIDSSADVAKVLAYLTERIGRALEYADNIEAVNSVAAENARQTAADFWQAADALKASGFTGGPTVININVKTDSTQSQAMVGKTIGNVVTKYVNQGGGILVSPVG